LKRISEEHSIKLEIHALRKTNKPLEKDIQDLINYEVSEDELSNDYDITFITNPTNLHYNTIKLMACKTKHMFIEKPLFDTNIYDISDLDLRENGVYYVAGPLRYTNIVQALKEILFKEDVYSVRAICSSYLPDWRPGVDYTKIYSAKKSEGGGVSIDLIHEWDYITYLFGFPDEVFNLKGKFSHLDIDSEDLSIYIAKYKDKLVEIHLDYFGRFSRREIELFTKNGTITGDFINKRITFTDSRKPIDFSLENTDMYIEEMKSFLGKVINNKYGENNITNAYKILKLATGRN
jgi:predicted dehydrogenase